MTLNIFKRTRDISFITTNCNYSYWHASPFKESNERFNRFFNVCSTSMFNVYVLFDHQYEMQLYM
jgi:hypothetical protein